MDRESLPPTFISHEHTTTGTAKAVRLADGSHTLRLEGLDTSNGPDLLPTDIDWSTVPSVSIWCDRFDVSFGAAALACV
ncbi:DM13 domain-containing protein [Streptomyces filamentosus]|uniref:DM13 domain-containing protein n=1 Tax=Streptomyces filamentosus TaxID=67294 RepID=A0A919EHC9_STRFL|nr:hypothetical protein GCM10017667_02180 [Streptomyces filamentosus]